MLVVDQDGFGYQKEKLVEGKGEKEKERVEKRERGRDGEGEGEGAFGGCRGCGSAAEHAGKPEERLCPPLD